MRLAFMGTPDFAATALAALHRAGHDIACVYSQPPRPAQRGQKLQPSAVHQLATGLGLPVRTPVSLKTVEAQAEFAALNVDVAVVAAYGLILPQPILDAPKRGCLNIHASLLPRWRGAAPIQRAILAGDSVTGVCIMQMEAGLDTGPVLLRVETPIGAQETAGSLHDRLAALGAAAIVDALAKLDTLAPMPQPEDGVTYAKKIDKAEAQLNFWLPADTLVRTVLAFAPSPGAWLQIGAERLKVLKAEAVEGHGAPGEVIDDAFTIACSAGALRPLCVQRAGKSVLTTAELLRGFAIPKGSRLLGLSAL
jgi:methionyl-tRNA formyltransferase